jgi:membrane-associated phospholipid phosphatase
MGWVHRFSRVRAIHPGRPQPPPLAELVAMFVLCTVCICGFYFGLVPRNGVLLANDAEFFCPTTSWDEALPIVPVFVWVYCAFYLVLPAIVVVTLVDRRVMYEGVVSYLVTGLLAFAIFFAIPSRMPDPQLGDCTTLACDVLVGMQSLDGGFNIFPSLHVAYPVVVLLLIRRYLPVAQIPVAIVVLGIMASTVLLKRHALVDVPAGALLGITAYLIGIRVGPRIAARTSVMQRASA